MAEYRYPYSAFSAGVLTPQELKSEIKKLITGHPDEAEEALLQLQFLFRDTDLPEPDYIAIRNLCETELAKSAFNLHGSSSRFGRDKSDLGTGLDFRSITLDGEFSDTAINKVLQEHNEEYQQELDRINSADNQQKNDGRNNGKKDQSSADATLVQLFPEEKNPQEQTVIQGRPFKDAGDSTRPFMKSLDSSQSSSEHQQAPIDQDEGDATRIMPSRPSETRTGSRNESEEDTLIRTAGRSAETEAETLIRSSAELASNHSTATAGGTRRGEALHRHAENTTQTNSKQYNSPRPTNQKTRQPGVWLDLIKNQRFVLNAIIGLCGITIVILLVMDEPELVDPSVPSTQPGQPISQANPAHDAVNSMERNESVSSSVNMQPSPSAQDTQNQSAISTHTDMDSNIQTRPNSSIEQQDLASKKPADSTAPITTQLEKPQNIGSSTVDNTATQARLAMTTSSHSRPPAYTTKDLAKLRQFISDAIEANDLEPESDATSALAYLAQMKAFFPEQAELREARADIAQAYLNLAKEARLLNRWSEAEEYVEKAIAVRIDR